MLDEGREEGREEGRTQGLVEGRNEGKLAVARELLREYVQRRFPDLLVLAEQKTTAIEQPEELEALVLKVILAQSQAEAAEHLKA